ncbi:MAG TPA: ABC transporter permease [Armatimonadota bacterium]|nr:ABC transporter permease [Armatimonadota bacterium]
MSVESPASPVAAVPEPAMSPPTSFWRAFWRHPMGVTGLVIVLLAVLMALAPLARHHLPLKDPNYQFPQGLTPDGAPRGPGGMFPLGSDNLGRDMLSRVVWGAQISLEVGFFAIAIAMGVGVLVGVTAGAAGGWVDTLMMRLTDVVMTIPSILLAIAIVAVQGKPSEAGVFIAIGFASWTGIARIIRGQVLQVKEKEFIEAARAIGCSPLRVACRHIIPNIVPLIVVLGTIGVAGTILLDAGLSYLGLGVPPPSASWGRMIADGQNYYLSAPWILLEPAMAASIVVIGFNMLGQALQELLDPYRVS